MATPEEVQSIVDWGTLVPVIVGGLLAAFGGLIGSVLLHVLSDQSSRKTKRAEKFEQMVNDIYAYQHWLHEVRQIRVYGIEGIESPSPFPRAQAIAAIYFPNFNDRLTELNITAGEFEIWMHEAALKRLAGKLEEMHDGMEEVYKSHHSNFVKLVAELQSFAKSEFR